jgi:hypothetical protein
MNRRDEPNDDGFDSLADATGMDEPAGRPAMESGNDEADDSAEDEATGDERTAIEGAAGLAATHRGFGGTSTDIEGGAGTNVPAEDDEQMTDAPDERKDSTDPRGY